MDATLDISKEEVAFIKTFLQKKLEPVPFDELALQIALFKTRDQRKSVVKVYHPGCEFKAGDLVYKEYPGALPVASKKWIELDEGVILKVEEARVRGGMHEIRMSYDGTSQFRLYIEFLHKQKIELLLPHKMQKPPREQELLGDADDPRAALPPLVEREFNLLRRKLSSVLHRENELIVICSQVLLKENLKQIPAEVVERIKEFLKGSGAAESTEFFVSHFLRLEADAPEFAAACFALNHLLGSAHKVDLLQTSTRGWGKWHLRSVLYQMKRGALVNELNPLAGTASFANRRNLAQKKKELDEAVFTEGERRYFLTQREVASGALRLHPGDLPGDGDLEILVVDSGSKKEFPAYFFPEGNLLLGLTPLYEHYRAIQGTVLHLESAVDGRCQFSIKTTKKGIVVDRIAYDPEQKLFRPTAEKVSTAVPIQRSIFLESEAFTALEPLIAELRRLPTLNKLIHRVFLEFGVRDRNYELHLMRLYHLLDLIYPVELRLVEEVILSNAEFIPAEKFPGVFYLDSDVVVEIEEEEKLRRQRVIEDNKRKREELRQKQVDEELRQKDELRVKREENRRKREEEMWQREKGKEERVAPHPTPVESVPVPGKEPVPPRAAPVAPPPQPGDELRAELARKPAKKKLDVEKPVKSVKKGQKRILEEKIELDEIKKEIQADDIKDVLPTAEGKKKSRKETNVAYQDQGGFGGIFASKLDEIVKKEEPTQKTKKKG